MVYQYSLSVTILCTYHLSYSFLQMPSKGGAIQIFMSVVGQNQGSVRQVIRPGLYLISGEVWMTTFWSFWLQAQALHYHTGLILGEILDSCPLCPLAQAKASINCVTSSAGFKTLELPGKKRGGTRVPLSSTLSCQARKQS